MPPFAKGNPGKPLGAKQKIPQTAKIGLALAFEGIGGVDALQRWARKNPDGFYSLWGRLVPHEVSGPEGGPLTITIERK